MDSTQVAAIISVIDFTAIAVGIGTIIGAIIIVEIAAKGMKMLISSVRGTDRGLPPELSELYEDEGDYIKYHRYRNRTPK